MDRERRDSDPTASKREESAQQHSTKAERKEILKADNNQCVVRIVSKHYQHGTREQYQDVNRRLNQVIGVIDIALADEEQLRRRLNVARHWHITGKFEPSAVDG